MRFQTPGLLAIGCSARIWRAVLHVEAPEVDQLARGVDLGLPRGLRLAQHRGRVEPRAPRTGEQVGRLEDDRGAVVEGEGAPPGCRLGGGSARPPWASRRVEFFITPSTLLVLRAAARPRSRRRRPASSVRRWWRSARPVRRRGGRAPPRPRRPFGTVWGVVQVRLVRGSRWGAEGVHPPDAARQPEARPTGSATDADARGPPRWCRASSGSRLRPPGSRSHRLSFSLQAFAPRAVGGRGADRVPDPLTREVALQGEPYAGDPCCGPSPDQGARDREVLVLLRLGDRRDSCAWSHRSAPSEPRRHRRA